LPASLLGLEEFIENNILEYNKMEKYASIEDVWRRLKLTSF